MSEEEEEQQPCVSYVDIELLDVPSTSSGSRKHMPKTQNVERKIRKTAKERYYANKLDLKRNREQLYEQYLEQKLQMRQEREKKIARSLDKVCKAPMQIHSFSQRKTIVKFQYVSYSKSLYLTLTVICIMSTSQACAHHNFEF